MSYVEEHPHSQGKNKKPESHKAFDGKDFNHHNDLWTDGLICAFEFVRGQKKSAKSKLPSNIPDRQQMDVEYPKTHATTNGLNEASSLRSDRNKLLDSSYDVKDGWMHTVGEDLQHCQINAAEKYEGSHWVPIGWTRVLELVQAVQVDAVWASQQFELADDEDDFTVADFAAPYWERPAGPIWWCNVSASHPNVQAWLTHAQWLHPAISLALRDESRLISERMRHLLYEVHCILVLSILECNYLTI